MVHIQDTITGKKRLIQDLKNLRYCLPALLMYCVIMQLTFKTVCPLKAFLGIPCPACGLTRGCCLLLVGKWRESLQYNPTAIFWLVTLVLFVVDRYIKKLKISVFPTLFIATAIITMFSYICRMTSGLIFIK